MDLLHKVRTLIGALAHQPFAPRPEKIEREGESEQPGEENRGHSLAREAGQPGAGVEQTERVADLIARHKRGENG